MDLAWSIGVLIGLFLLFKNRSYLKEALCHPGVWLPLLFWVVTIISRFANQKQMDGSLLLENRWALEIGLFALVLLKVKDWASAFTQIAVGSILLQILGFMWFYFFRDSAPALSERFGGFHANPMFWGQISGFVAVFSLANCFLGSTKVLRLLFTVSFLINFISLVLTGTRGAWMATFISIPIIFFFTHRELYFRILAGFGVTVLLVVLLIPPVKERVLFTLQGLQGAQTYDSERVALWKANWEMFKDHPILGVGFGANKENLRSYYDKLGYPKTQFESHAHNQYLQILAGTGLVGFFIYLSFFVYFILASLKLIKSNIALFKQVGVIGISTLFYFMIASLTEANFNISKTRYSVLLIFSLILAFSFRQKNEAIQ
jgi:O-antigen ligase